ncbi:small ubiquitin-related modifier 1-like [Lycium barbarum]|uniref:small ubiquitin-related modifier 1-like n=1 Tax=Lycium barbarum TaxID=112863 RepID=UPI00293F6503|nr:small ubiquitin-related modifier 1-like [Lycium barbarum]
MTGDKRNKRPLEEPTDALKLKITSQDGTIVSFKANPSLMMKEIFKAYCKKKQIIDYKTVRFFCDGQRLSPNRTVNELGLENDDQIDAMLKRKDREFDKEGSSRAPGSGK